jgi:hypothetical protein
VVWRVLCFGVCWVLFIVGLDGCEEDCVMLWGFWGGAELGVFWGGLRGDFLVWGGGVVG